MQTEDEKIRDRRSAQSEPASLAAAAGATRDTAGETAGRRNTMLAPFGVRAFRIQWPGDLMTAVAIEMEMVILGWYVLNETGSVLLLTLFGALHFFGTLSAPLIGVVGDRIGLSRLLALMRAHYVVLTTILTALALSGRMSPLVVFVISTLMALVRPSDISVRTALVAELMPPGLLTGAVGVSRSTGDVARIFGALAGATLFALFGIGLAYIVVLALYVGGLALTAYVGRLTTSRPRTSAAGAAGRSPLKELAAGAAYVWQTPHLQGGMWLAVLANLTAFPLTGGLMPYIAKHVYGLDKTGLGVLVASFAFGALIGSLTVGAIGRRLMLGRAMLITAVVWHGMLLGFIHAPGVVIGGLFLVLAGFMQSISMVALAAMLLRTSEPAYHGRIMGVRMLATYSLPIGLLALGALIEAFGFAVSSSLWVAAGVAVTLAIAANWRRSLWASAAPANQR